MDILQQGRETIAVIIVSAGRRGTPFGERPPQGDGDSGLVGRILKLNDSSFHGNFACGILV